MWHCVLLDSVDLGGREGRRSIVGIDTLSALVVGHLSMGAAESVVGYLSMPAAADSAVGHLCMPAAADSAIGHLSEPADADSAVGHLGMPAAEIVVD